MTDQPKTAGLRWSFSTLGCAELTFPEICELAGDFRMDGIELRGIAGRLDLPQYCQESGWTPARMLEACRRQRTRLVVAGSSFKLTSSREKDRAELLQFCAWADALGIPYVRVFGGGTWGQPLGEADYTRAVEVMSWWRAERLARGWSVELLLETHDAFSGSAPCLELMERLPQPLPLIWDSHHTWRLGGETPAHTWSRLERWIRHVHLKDSIDQPSARHPFTYVLPGAGQMPMDEVIALLRTSGFRGFVSLEWERLWHPYLPPLREALLQLQKQPWFEIPAHESPLPAAAH